MEGRNRTIGDKRQRRAGIQQRSKRVSRPRAFATDSLFGPTAIIYRVVGLHRSDDTVAGKARNVLRSQVLSMLDAEAPIPIAVFFFNPLVDRKDVVVRAIADGMNDYLQA